MRAWCKPNAARSRLAPEPAVLADAQGLRFELSMCAVTPAAEAWVWTDPVLLERVLRNLLVNALRYTDHGRVALHLRVRHGRAEIQVADTGPGIPRAQQQVVFEEFVQLGSPRGAREQSLGLGLSIVSRLVALLQLRLRSRPGRGTVVGLLLPLMPPPDPARSRARLSVQGDTRSGLQAGDVVLVVDDAKGMRLAKQGLEANAELREGLQRGPGGRAAQTCDTGTAATGHRPGP